MQFINFEKYPFTITNIEFKRKFADSYRRIIIKTDGERNLKLIAEGDEWSRSVFRVYEDNYYDNLIGKVILSIREIELSEKEQDELDEFYSENSTAIVYDGIEYYSITHKLYEAQLLDGTLFKFLIANFSICESDLNNGYLIVKTHKNKIIKI
jgi:hypothetical protein